MEENQDFNLLPPYLVDSDGAQSPESQTQRTYGTLSYNRRGGNAGRSRATPCVTELCQAAVSRQRHGRGRGEARFTAHRRVVGDLNWLMLRYPLAGEDRRSASAGKRRWRRPGTTPCAGSRPGGCPETAAARRRAVFRGAADRLSAGGAGVPAARRERCLLADEMGLGKTVQALAFLCQHRRPIPPFVVAPPHLMRNWQSEIAALSVRSRTARACGCM